MPNSDDGVLYEWLDANALNFAEFEREYRPYADEDPGWRDFFDQIQPGDELREFTTPRGSFAKCQLKAGYAIVRRGKIVAAIITIRNDRTQHGGPTLWKADGIA